jgi:hypothetical protein
LSAKNIICQYATNEILDILKLSLPSVSKYSKKFGSDLFINIGNNANHISKYNVIKQLINGYSNDDIIMFLDVDLVFNKYDINLFDLVETDSLYASIEYDKWAVDNIVPFMEKRYGFEIPCDKYVNSGVMLAKVGSWKNLIKYIELYDHGSITSDPVSKMDQPILSAALTKGKIDVSDLGCTTHCRIWDMEPDPNSTIVHFIGGDKDSKLARMRDFLDRNSTI